MLSLNEKLSEVQLLRFRATFQALERLRVTFTANGKRQIQVKLRFLRMSKTILMDKTDVERLIFE